MARKKKYSVDHIRQRHERAYEAWTAEEDEKLRRCAHLPAPTLAGMFRRKPGAIQGRLRKLRLGTAGSPQDVATVVQEEPATGPEAVPATKRGDALQRADSVSVPKGKPTRIGALVVGGFVAGPLIGLVIGYFAGLGSSLPVPVPEQESQTPQVGQLPQALDVQHEDCLSIATWNIRGYPERRPEDTVWFHEQLRKLNAEVLCIQEIANDNRLGNMLASGTPFAQYVFTDSGSGQDNAILAVDDVVLKELRVTGGFRHAPQAAFVAYRGFDAVVVTVHLSWEPVSRRLDEMGLLESLVHDMLQIDPDVMLVGDFNLDPDEVSALAERLGMSVLFAPDQVAVGTLHSGNSYDYFLVSPDLATEEAQGATVVVFEGTDVATSRRVSDHMPLLAFFACDDGFRDRPLGIDRTSQVGEGD